MPRRGRAGRATDGGKRLAEIFEGGEFALWGLIAAWVLEFCKRGVSGARERRKFQRKARQLAQKMRTEAIEMARTMIQENYDASLAELEEGLKNLDIQFKSAEAAGQEAEAKLEALIQELSDGFSSGLRTMVREADDVYRHVIEAAHEARGNLSLEAAVQDALNRFAGEGITGFVDKAGRHWGLWEYADMAMRTALNRASLRAEITGMMRAGLDLCYVSRHTGACPICVQWQGRLLSLTGRTPGFPTLQQAMDAGLFHPNCADILNAYIAGVSRLDIGMPEDTSPAVSAEIYQKRQQQRYMERQVRKWKRRQAAAINPENERVSRAHVNLWQRRIRQFIDGDAQLPRRYDREGGRVKLSEEARKLKPIRIGGSGIPQKSSVENAVEK